MISNCSVYCWWVVSITSSLINWTKLVQLQYFSTQMALQWNWINTPAFHAGESGIVARQRHHRDFCWFPLKLKSTRQYGIKPTQLQDVKKQNISWGGSCQSAKILGVSGQVDTFGFDPKEEGSLPSPPANLLRSDVYAQEK